MDKKAANKAHARSRAKQRVGLDLGPKRLESAIKSIQDGTAEFVRRVSNSRTVWNVLVDAEVLQVVYCKRTKTLVTVLEQD